MTGHDTSSSQTITETTDDRVVADRQPLQAGEYVEGRYCVDALLGRGGYGEVYRVVDERDEGRGLALKLHRMRSLSRGAIAALRSEFGLLSTLSHPNLATVYDFAYLEGEYAYFTQTLIDGAPLHRASVDPLSERGVRLLAQLCRALDYLHSRGIVHGDVKPGNILVDRAGEHLTLLDFGIARALGVSASGRVVGSPSYMAPELVTGGAIDGRTDLYALGVTLYQLISGTVPFKGTSTRVLFAHVSEEPPELPETVPAPLRALVSKLVAKEPDDRPPNASAVLRELAALVGVEVDVDTDETLASHVLSARCVGRDAVLEELLARSTDPGASGPPLLVMGGVGSGKSRLVRELRRRVQLRGLQWVQVVARRAEGDADLLVRVARATLGRAQIAELSDEERIELARALPELRDSRERIAMALDPEAARGRRLAILGEKVASRFSWKPGVFAVEDLHWASATELESLARLIQHARARGVACLFLLASRPTDDSLATIFAAEELECGHLAPSDARALVEGTFGDGAVLDGSALGAEIASSPSPALWLQESLRLALERGAIVRRKGRFTRVSEIEAKPLGRVLEERIDRLTRHAERLALTCAVLEGEHTAIDLEHAARMKHDNAVAALAELVRSGILDRRLDGHQRARYTMHDRYAEAALERAADKPVRETRRRAGRWLAKRDAKDYRGLARAAQELAAAGDTARAIRVLVKAEVLAVDAGRPEHAARLAARELELRGGDDPARLARLVHAHDLAARVGRRSLALDSLAEAEELARESGDPAETLAVALRRARRAFRDGELADAGALCEPALDEARRHGLDALVCELSILGAEIEYPHGDTRLAIARYVDASERARAARRRDLEATAEMGLAMIHVRLGQSQGSTRAAQRAAKAAQRTRDPVLRSNALRILGNAHFVASDRERALEAWREAVVVARESGDSEAEAKALNNVGIAAHGLGRVREALRAWRRAIELKERVGATTSALLTWASMSSVLMIIGEREDAYAAQETVLKTDREDALIAMNLAWSNRGDLETFEGRLDAAIESYRKASDGYRAIDMNQLRSHALTGEIRARLMRGLASDLGEVGALLREMEAAVEETSANEDRRRMLTTRAMVLDARGDPAAALEDARRAARLVQPDTTYDDAFGSPVEATWMVATLLARMGRVGAASRAAGEAAERLEERVRALDHEHDRQGFIGRHPLHRTIVARATQTAPGTTFSSTPT